MAANKHFAPTQAPLPPAKDGSLQGGRKSGNCAINKIREGMRLEDVRSRLGHVHLEYRGAQRTEDAYFVDAGACKATLNFDPDKKTLDFISYEPNSPDNSETAQSAEASPNAAETAPDRTPATAGDVKRVHLPEVLWVDAYVKANSGIDNFDDKELAKFAHDEFVAHEDLYPDGMTLSDDFATARGRRAVAFIEAHLQSTQARASTETPLD